MNFKIKSKNDRQLYTPIPIYLIYLILFLFIIINSCSAVNPNNFKREKVDDSIKSNLYEGIIRMSSKKVIKTSEGFFIELENISPNDIFIYRPWAKNIEKKIGDNWIKVKILYCPCGQYCDPPPIKKILLPGQKYRQYWNLFEGWCDESSTDETPKTIEYKVTKGHYRITSFYGLKNGDEKTIIEEFEIIE